jgi:hypothetical protein
MDDRTFDHLTRGLVAVNSRRRLLTRLATMSLAGGVLASLDHEEALGKHGRKRRKHLVFNSFGCVDVGGKCRGNSANCCSSICTGKKPKKGKRDRSVCEAHNALTCTAAQDNCLMAPNPCGVGGSCFRTTGNASFCGNQGVCSDCTRDADCEALKGPGAACAVCASACPAGRQTACFQAF